MSNRAIGVRRADGRAGGHVKKKMFSSEQRKLGDCKMAGKTKNVVFMTS
jgi:hypothetical protein